MKMIDYRGFRPAVLLLVVLLLNACQAIEISEPEKVAYGVLVMAHGGSEQWNSAVERAVGELETEYPVALAFGMADAGSLEVAVRQLEARGVEHVGVVRLFVSGESWYERTRQILGIAPGAPDKQTALAQQAGRPAMGMPMGFWQIETDLQFHLSEEGLADAGEMDQVVLSRASALSENPANEVLVVLAHGPGDDAENQRWIEKISKRTELARERMGFTDVRVFTLREDWQDKRRAAEQEIRHYMQQASMRGQTVLVLPYRVMGFGPYHEVLAGLDYEADETGLVPHDNVNRWLMNQAQQLKAVSVEHQRSLLAATSL
jgi:sirohydrochlorin ferrochelatase